MKYERLTERYENGAVQYEDRNGYFHTFYSGNDGDPVHALVWKLAELEDKIEQGTLKEIPCNVGDTLYTNSRWEGDYTRKEKAPYPVKVVFIGLNNSKEMGFGFVNVINEKSRMWQVEFSNIGKTLFLTCEEAKQHLKELRE